MGSHGILKEYFKIQKWKWYVVDHTNLHDPIIIRKHCETKEQADFLRKRHYNTADYSVVNWKTAEEMGLRDYPSRSKRHHKRHLTKYNYPPGCDTRLQRKMFRDVERRKRRQKMRLPKVTETAVWEIMDDKPVLFVKRISHYKDNHWAFSEPVEGLNDFKKEYQWPRDIRHLCNIVRVLNEYYNIGPYDMAQVALFIYKKWGARIRKHCGGVRAIPQNHEKVILEFKARGFVEEDTLNYDPDQESWVESIHIKPKLAHPEVCWHTARDKQLYDHNIYDFQSGMGIPGYTRSAVAGLERRK